MKRTLLLLTIFALSPLLNAQNMGGSPDPIDGSIYHTGGNVGIGTTSPSTLLSIGIADTGNQYGKGIQIKRGSGYLKFQNGTATSLFSPNITGKATTNWATAGLFIKGIPTNDQTDFAGIILIAGESAPLVNADVLRIRNYSTDLFTINSGGRVGIGTTTPNSKLEIGVPHAINQDEEIRIGSYWQGNFLGLGFNYTINNIGTVSKHLVEHHGGIKYTAMTFNHGNVGIGTTDPKGYKLAVAGNVVAEEVNVKLQANWPDYVFTPTYYLPTLEEVKQHIDEKGHLPNIPSAAEVAENGINLGEMNAKLLEKIEELTLYVFQLKKENEKQNETIQELIVNSKK